MAYTILDPTITSENYYFVEWNVTDNWDCGYNCDLCGTQIRYEFELINKKDPNIKKIIWCECVKKFDVELWKIAVKDKRKFLKNKSIERVLSNLGELAIKDTTTDYSSFIKQFEKYWGFSPKQIILLNFRLEYNNIKFEYSDYKVLFQKDKNKEQLLTLTDQGRETLKKYMTSEQKKKYFCGNEAKVNEIKEIPQNFDYKFKKTNENYYKIYENVSKEIFKDLIWFGLNYDRNINSRIISIENLIKFAQKQKDSWKTVGVIDNNVIKSLI